MRGWLLILLSLSCGLRAQPASEERFQVRFNTFPTCDVYLWKPVDKTWEGQYSGLSSQPVNLPSPQGQSLLIYFIYSDEARRLMNTPTVAQADFDQAKIPFRSLSYKALKQIERNGGVFSEPIFLLTTPAAWWVFVKANWLPLLGAFGGLGWALRWWQKRRRQARRDFATTTVGRFVLRHSLGKGGAGEVFLAEDDQNQRVALKLLHGSAADGVESARFLREVQICAKMHHPNIVRLVDWGQQGDMLYLAMELLEGETLGERLRRQRLLGCGEFVELLMPLAGALQTLHQQGMVHRDLKPDNVFLRFRGGPALMDFGIASGQDMTRATQTGLAVGTPTYMAPEQTQGAFEPATDQYALGVLAFVCLTGRRPFEADDPATMAYLHVHSPAPAPSKLNPELPGGVDGVILKMLSKKPAQRFESIQAAAEALKEALSGPAFLDEGTIASKN